MIAVTEEGNTELDDMCEAVIYIPRTTVWLSPMLTVIPLQVRLLLGPVCKVSSPRLPSPLPAKPY